MDSTVLVTNDAVLFGLLSSILALVFYTANSEQRFWRQLYRFVPPLLLCYFLPSLLKTFNIADPSQSNLYFVASRYLLPAGLILLTLSIDLKSIMSLGYKPLLMFLTGTVGVIIGGPIAILLLSVIAPEMVAGDTWKGMATIAGSWIGGGANQAAMKEMYHVSDDLFAVMVTIDVLVEGVWLAVLLVVARNAAAVDKKLQADNTAVEQLKIRVEQLQKRNARNLNLQDLMMMFGVTFALVGAAHGLSGLLAPWIGENSTLLSSLSLNSRFFWLVILATLGGVALSFTKFRSLEGAGASKIGSLFIYILIATIGMKMDITAVFRNLELFSVGFIWIIVHILLLVIVAKLIKAPAFYLAVGSQANLGGAASAPVVAAAFHPSLAPVGVLLAVLGYAVGTAGAWLCAEMMRVVVT